MGLFRPRKKNVEDTSNEVVGGFAFFLSLFLLFPTGLLFLLVSLSQIRYADLSSFATFVASLLLGMGVAHYGIKGHLSVLIHEWKHQVVSNLVGNKNKRMEINENTGSLQYEYTKHTAHYNAFIALAPYILPVFTCIACLITFAIQASNPLLPLAIIGVAYGIDSLMNARDISPIQTDISLIRGGFTIGLLYILAWNMLTTALTCAWAFQGWSGVGELFETILRLFIALYSTLTGWQPGGSSD